MNTWVPWVGFAVIILLAGGVLSLAYFLIRWIRGEEVENSGPRLTLAPTENGDVSPSTEKFDRAFNRLVMESGLPLSPTVTMILWLGTSLLVGATLFVAFENLLVSLLGAVTAVILFLVVIMALRTRRQRKIMENLPATIDMLAQSVRAGESLEQALHLAAEKARGPLASDLRRCVQQIDMGLSVAAALHRLQDRYRLLDVRMFVSAVAAHRQTGGNLPATLGRLSMVMKERLEYRRQLRSITASGRLAAFIIVLAAPLVFLYYLFSKVFAENMFDDPNGQFFLLLAVGLEVVGLIWLLAVTRTEL